MIRPSKMLLVLLTTNFILIGLSSAASAYRRKPDATTYKVTIPSSPTTDQNPSPNLMAESQASTYKTSSSRGSTSRFKRFHQCDVSVAANPGAPLVQQENDTIIAATVNSSAAHVPPSWRAWLPTLGTTLNSVVHVIIMILGVLNISINPRIHGESLEETLRKICLDNPQQLSIVDVDTIYSKMDGLRSTQFEFNRPTTPANH